VNPFDSNRAGTAFKPKPTGDGINPAGGEKPVSLDVIHADEQAQPRAALDTDRVAEYVEAMVRGEKFPRLVLFQDKQGRYWLADGFHRYYAAINLEWKTIECIVYSGELRDAVLFSCGANATHGLPRSNDDKRQAVTKLLKDPEWSGWSNVEISKRCRVSDEFVRKLRQQLEPVTSNIGSENERTYTDKHGNTVTMHTGNIGRKPKPAASSNQMPSPEHGQAREDVSSEPALPDRAPPLSPEQKEQVPRPESAPAPQQLDLIRDTTPAAAIPAPAPVGDRVAYARAQIGSLPETTILVDEVVRRTRPDTGIVALAVAVRRRTRHPEVITLCDWVIAHGRAIGRVSLADCEGADCRGEVEQMPPLPD
jgi:hypothetical protein